MGCASKKKKWNRKQNAESGGWFLSDLLVARTLEHGEYRVEATPTSDFSGRKPEGFLFQYSSPKAYENGTPLFSLNTL